MCMRMLCVIIVVTLLCSCSTKVDKEDVSHSTVESEIVPENEMQKEDSKVALYEGKEIFLSDETVKYIESLAVECVDSNMTELNIMLSTNDVNEFKKSGIYISYSYANGKLMSMGENTKITVMKVYFLIGDEGCYIYVIDENNSHIYAMSQKDTEYIESVMKK